MQLLVGYTEYYFDEQSGKICRYAYMDICVCEFMFLFCFFRYAYSSLSLEFCIFVYNEHPAWIFQACGTL